MLTTEELAMLQECGIAKETVGSRTKRYRELDDAVLQNMRNHLVKNRNWDPMKVEAFMIVWKERLVDPKSKIVNLKFPAKGTPKA